MIIGPGDPKKIYGRHTPCHMTRKDSFRILLVEDEDSHAELVTAALRSADPSVEIDRARDGLEALASVEAQSPDLILLDLRLPRIDGYEVLKKIKDDPKLRRVPTIVVTAHSTPAERDRAYSSYANSYLVKPQEWSEFKALADSVVRYWTQWNLPAPA
jgi:CheY-like chemotaxis protein